MSLGAKIASLKRRIKKESSDEISLEADLNRRNWWRNRQGWSARDYLAVGVASTGVGFLPLVPGTWGSLVGVGLYLLARYESGRVFNWALARGWTPPPLESFRISFILLFLIGLFIAGTWAASRVEKLMGRKDPGVVVVDEVIGQLITYLFLPIVIDWWEVVLGFLAFRFFDIVKPYPVRRLEGLPGGLGIMADDVMAGFYAATFMSLVTTAYLLLF